MTTYPHHRIHAEGRPSNVLLLVAAVVLAVVGVGAWLLVDHYTGGSKGISDAQAITFIQTGTGLPGLNMMNGNPNAHGSALPAAQRPYALRMYRTGPYDVRALNLFYALGATSMRYASSSLRQIVGAMGRAKLLAQVQASVTRPSWITQYGVSVADAANAVVRGMLVGVAQ